LFEQKSPVCPDTHPDFYMQHLLDMYFSAANFMSEERLQRSDSKWIYHAVYYFDAVDPYPSNPNSNYRKFAVRFREIMETDNSA
jgi:hypothetical protein